MYPSPYPPPFHSAHFRATIVKILLVVGAVVAAISLLTDALSLAFPPPAEGQEVGENPIAAVLVLIVVLLALLSVMIYLTTVVFFLMWLYRAYGNLRAFDPSRPLDHSPGWAVGSFFIPFVNLVIPYRAVKETWQKSGPPDEALLSEPAPPATFPVWWLFWLLSCIAGNISMRASFNENVPESTAMIIATVADGLSILAALFAYLVVDAIDKRQEETSARAKLGTFPGPPPPPNLSVPDLLAPAP
jgi:membrane protease YdiL (CAAX protease family)